MRSYPKVVSDRKRGDTFATSGKMEIMDKDTDYKC